MYSAFERCSIGLRCTVAVMFLRVRLFSNSLTCTGRRVLCHFVLHRWVVLDSVLALLILVENDVAFDCMERYYNSSTYFKAAPTFVFHELTIIVYAPKRFVDGLVAVVVMISDGLLQVLRRLLSVICNTLEQERQ